jgi:hypothetical protein
MHRALGGNAISTSGQQEPRLCRGDIGVPVSLHNGCLVRISGRGMQFSSLNWLPVLLADPSVDIPSFHLVARLIMHRSNAQCVQRGLEESGREILSTSMAT